MLRSLLSCLVPVAPRYRSESFSLLLSLHSAAVEMSAPPAWGSGQGSNTHHWWDYHPGKTRALGVSSSSVKNTRRTNDHAVLLTKTKKRSSALDLVSCFKLHQVENGDSQACLHRNPGCIGSYHRVNLLSSLSCYPFTGSLKSLTGLCSVTRL